MGFSSVYGPFRRRFLRRSVAAFITLPGLAIAQAPGGARRVALLLSGTPAATAHLVKALVGGLVQFDWIEGRNLRLDIRHADGDLSRLRSLAAGLLGLKPDVIVASNEQVAREAVALTKTVPIVFAVGFDPVGTKLVQSLARPGGNVTGLSTLSYELVPKRLELLKKAVPTLKRVAVIYRAGDANADRVLKSLVEPALTLGLTIIPGEVSDATGFDRAFEHFSKQKAGGILQAPDAYFFSHAARIAELTVKHSLAAGFGVSESARFGALFSYGPDFTAIFRRSATLVDKILKGAKPADLPVEQVNVYELVVNLKTARALGIKLPPSFMLQATQTIE